MRKALLAMGTAIMFIIISLAAVYLLLGEYYRTGFSCATWINGIYCTGKSVQEVNSELVSKNIYPGITVYGPDDSSIFISASAINHKFDYTETLERALREQNSYAWGFNIFKTLTADYEPKITYNEGELRRLLLKWDIFSYEEDLKVEILKGVNGYYLYDGLHNIPDRENIVRAVVQAVDNLEVSIDITASPDNFTDMPLSARDEEIIRIFGQIDDLQNCNLSYDLAGKTISITPEVVSEFIMTDEMLDDALSEDVSNKNDYEGRFISDGKEIELSDGYKVYRGFILSNDGNVILSEKRIHDYFAQIADEYDTKWLMQEYREGLTKQIAISNNRKGNGAIFDMSYAFDNFKNAYLNGTYLSEDVFSVALNKDVKIYDADEIGNTYIEVNMKDQMLYYYVDGQLNMDMPIVTGNVNRSRGTPTGIYNVYNKRYHTTLRGVGYVSYVNYWLGVDKGVGIHDANWRDEFGEEIYKSDGSHGCINCPEEQVSKLWEVVDVGTPVVLYY